MELQEFITATLTQVVAGIKKAQETYPTEINPPLHAADLKTLGFAVSGDSQAATCIEFDVAVSASSDTATEGRAGVHIKVLELGTGGASSSSNSSVSKVKFKIPVVLPISQRPQTQ